MRNIVAITLILFFLVGVSLALATPNNTTIGSIQINDLIQAEKGFSTSSSEWSQNGKYLLIRSSKAISMFESINKHYLVDVDNKTYGKIDYGITEEESTYISSHAGWAPAGNKIYFTITKRGHGRGTGGGNCVICDPDGTYMRILGSPNKTTLSEAMSNLGGGITRRDLTFSPDSSKVAYQYEDPTHFYGNLWIEDMNGTNAFELRANGRKLVWYNSTTVYFLTQYGTLMVTDDKGNSIRAFTPDNDEERYVHFSISPDKQKIKLESISENNEWQNYIANIDGSNLVKSEIDSWQPNGSSMVLNKNGNLYILEGKEHTKRILYEGNATKPQWFPDGKKILFLENKNSIYSMDADGTNLSFITKFGQTTHYLWDRLEIEPISISPSGDVIAFTSALYPNGELIDLEPSLNKAKNIAAPLFIINSDGTNRTRLTSAIKGRHDFLDGWSPGGKMMTVDYIHFSENGNIHGSPYLFSLDGTNITEEWQGMPVSRIIGSDNPLPINNSSQMDENPMLNETASNVTKNKKTPSFLFSQFIFCIMAMWVLQKKKR